MEFDALTPEKYEEVKKAFDELGKNYAAVSKRARVDKRTAKRAWEKGWPDRGWAPLGLGKEPSALDLGLQEVERAAKGNTRAETMARKTLRIVRETAQRTKANLEAARAEVEEAARAHQAEIELALQRTAELERITREQAERARTEEGALVQSLRTISLGMLVTLEKALVVLPHLSERLQKTLETLSADPQASLHSITDALRAYVKLAATTSEVAQRAMELQRLANGEPTEILRVQHQNAGVPLDVEQAAREIERAGRSLERARTLGLVKPAPDNQVPPEPPDDANPAPDTQSA